MSDINNIITTNFTDNISYLEKHHSKLFAKLSALDSAIANGHYQEKYELVYENDGFDVFERSSNTYLYAKESLAHTLISTNSVNFKNDDSLFEGFTRRSFSQDELNSLGDEKACTNFLSDIAPLIHYTNENSPKEKELKSIDKFIFFGVGLGLHIEAIHQKINSKIYFIIEDDLELFRLSLFTTNYKDIAKDSTILFSVFENQDEFMNTSAIFLNTSYYYNHYLKYFSLLSHSEDKKNQLQIAITSQPHIRFNFINLLQSYLSPLRYLFDDYKILQNTLRFDTKYFQDKPFILLAMGPSLQKNIEWLKNNHNNFITIAVSSSLSYLEEQKIVPDIIIHIDPFEWGIKSFEKLKHIEYIKDSLCFFSAATPSNIMSLFNKEQIFLFETGTSYKALSIKPLAPCVGSLTYQLLLMLKIKNIYLLGLDLAVDSKTGRTHSGSHQSLAELDTQEDAFKKDSISYKESLFPVDGNFKKRVLTTPDFYASIYTIEYFSKLLQDKSQTVVNLSSGARFTQSIAKNVNELEIKQIDSKIKMRENLKILCDKNSQIKFTNSETQQLIEKLKHANLQKQYIQEKQTPIESELEVYLLDICNNLASDKDMKNYELSRVLDIYLKETLSYIFNFFNNKDRIKDENNLNNLDKILKKHLNKIITFYIDSLEDKILKINLN